MEPIEIFFHDLFNIGIFLGYSILQLLEYGVAVIIIPMEIFQEFLLRKITHSKREEQVTLQENMDIQNEFASDGNDSQIIETDLDPVVKNYIDYDGKFQAIQKQIKEIKARIGRYEKQGIPR